MNDQPAPKQQQKQEMTPEQKLELMQMTSEAIISEFTAQRDMAQGRCANFAAELAQLKVAYDVVTKRCAEMSQVMNSLVAELNKARQELADVKRPKAAVHEFPARIAPGVEAADQPAPAA